MAKKKLNKTEKLLIEARQNDNAETLASLLNVPLPLVEAELAQYQQKEEKETVEQKASLRERERDLGFAVMTEGRSKRNDDIVKQAKIQENNSRFRNKDIHIIDPNRACY